MAQVTMNSPPLELPMIRDRYPADSKRQEARRLFLKMTTATGGILFAQGAGLCPAIAEALIPLSLRGLVASPLVDSMDPRGPMGKPIASGAVGLNGDFEAGKRPDLLIEMQANGGDWIQYGLVHNRPDWCSVGWRIFRWGMSHQLPDGSFPEGKQPEFGTALFIEALGRSLLLAREFGDTSHEREFVPGVAKAAWWIGAHNLDSDWELVFDRQFAHRFWLYAAALGDAGKLTGDARLLAISGQFARRGVLAQRANGVDPEKGGFDVGYQAAGLVFAARYLVVADSLAGRAGILRMLRKGIGWLASRVEANGDVDGTGSTRIGIEHDRSGRIKQVFYGVLVEAFGSYAYVSGDHGYDALALRVRRSKGFRDHFDPRLERKVSALGAPSQLGK
jgi:hypothetical protein